LEELFTRLTGIDPRICPCCGKGLMVRRETLLPLIHRRQERLCFRLDLLHGTVQRGEICPFRVDTFKKYQEFSKYLHKNTMLYGIFIKKHRLYYCTKTIFWTEAV